MSRPTEEFWDALGIAAIILAVCLGIGSCSALVNLTERPAALSPDKDSKHGK